MQDKIVKHKKINIWTEAFGDKRNPVILLISGAHAPSLFWPDFFCKNLVKKNFFVIRYDHRDIGYSTHFPKTADLSKPVYTLKDLTDDAIRILDSYKIKKAYVVGHSMGGSIVQYMLAYYPSRVLRGFSISVSVDMCTHKHPKFDKIMNELMKNKPTGNFNADWPGWMRSWKILHGTIPITKTMAKNYTKCIYDRHQGDYEPAWNQMAAHNTKKIVLDKLPANTVLINGTEDLFSPMEEIDKLSRRFTVVRLEGAGHVFFNKKIFSKISEIILSKINTVA